MRKFVLLVSAAAVIGFAGAASANGTGKPFTFGQCVSADEDALVPGKNGNFQGFPGFYGPYMPDTINTPAQGQGTGGSFGNLPFDQLYRCSQEYGEEAS